MSNEEAEKDHSEEHRKENQEENLASNHTSAESSGSIDSDFGELSSEELAQQLASEEYEGSELMDILYQLESLISEARSLPMSASVLVNKAQMQSLLQSAREAIPADVQTANQIVMGADAIIDKAQKEAKEAVENARNEAEQIVAQAHTSAEELVAKERIVKMAQERADQIANTSAQRATALAQGADNYCDKQLAQMEVVFEQHLKQIRSGREVLAKRKKFDPENLEDEESLEEADD